MIYIYSVNTDQFRRTTTLGILLEQIPQSMHGKALRYRKEEDAFNYVLGRLLLKEGLKHLGLDHDLTKITFQKNGKPAIQGVFFNISHSANLVVCTIAKDGEIGIDVEKNKSIPLNDMRRSFTQKEWQQIMNDPTPLEKFYWYWTRKESIIKALGVNLSYLHQIEIDATQDFFMEKDKKWYLRDLDFGDDFFGALCSEMEIKEDNFLIKKLSSVDLLGS